MSGPGQFLSDIESIRRKARAQLSAGPVTGNYGGASLSMKSGACRSSNERGVAGTGHARSHTCNSLITHRERRSLTLNRRHEDGYNHYEGRSDNFL